MAIRILLAERDQTLLKDIAGFLKLFEFEVDTASSVERVFDQVNASTPGLIALGEDLSKGNILSIVQKLDKLTNPTPIIVFRKPFVPNKLVAFVHAALGLATPDTLPLFGDPSLLSGGLRIGRFCRRAWLNGRELKLSAKAFAVLEYLMLHPKQVVTRERLLKQVWGWEHATNTSTRTIDTRVAELRRKLDDASSAPRFIETVIGVGYRFIQTVEESKGAVKPTPQ